jgi:hypothetical protein
MAIKIPEVKDLLDVLVVMILDNLVQEHQKFKTR